MSLLLLLGAVYALAVWRLGSLLRPETADGTEPLPGLSVLVCYRNEQERIAACLESLLEQDHPELEVLAINDRSEDQGPEIVAGMARKHPRRLQALAAPAPGGKKRGLSAGMQAATYDLLAVVDADSRAPQGWARRLAGAFDQETGLVAAPVVFESGNSSLFSRAVASEYAALLGAGLAALADGRPLFASGSNLAWRRQAFLDAGGYQGLEDIPSGDDTLLLQRIHTRTRWKLRSLLDPRAVIHTRGPSSLAELVRQRVRWNSTERHYPDPLALLAALAVYTVWLGLPLSLVLALAGRADAGAVLLLWLLKLLPDLRLAGRARETFGLPKDSLSLLPAWLLQLGYGLLVPWLGLAGRFRWREGR